MSLGIEAGLNFQHKETYKLFISEPTNVKEEHSLCTCAHCGVTAAHVVRPIQRLGCPRASGLMADCFVFTSQNTHGASVIGFQGHPGASVSGNVGVEGHPFSEKGHPMNQNTILKGHQALPV